MTGSPPMTSPDTKGPEDLIARLKTDAAFLRRSERDSLKVIAQDSEDAATALEALTAEVETLKRERDEAREETADVRKTGLRNLDLMRRVANTAIDRAEAAEAKVATLEARLRTTAATDEELIEREAIRQAELDGNILDELDDHGSDGANKTAYRRRARSALSNGSTK